MRFVFYHPNRLFIKLFFLFEKINGLCLIALVQQYYWSIIFDQGCNIYTNYNVQAGIPAMQDKHEVFKQKLRHLHRQFFNYLKSHKTKTIPLEKAGLIIQQFFPMNPTYLKHWLQKSNNSSSKNSESQISWQNLLDCLYEEIELRDQVTKLQYSKPSILNTSFNFCQTSEIDDVLPDEKFSSIIQYVKKKQTNMIRMVKKCQFLGFNFFAIVLDAQIIFYDCTKYEFGHEDKSKIVKQMKFNYHNVRQKLIRNQLAGSVGNVSEYQNIEKIDKVNPMSRRTDEFIFSYKERKNTNQSDELKHLCTNLKKSKMASSQCSQVSEVRRSMTESSKISRTITSFGKMHKWNSGNKNPKAPSMAKIRSNDTKAAFKIMTQAPISNSIQFIKAYQESRQNFEKYITIEKDKIKKEQLEEIKQPSAKQQKHNFPAELMKMKKESAKISHRMHNKAKSIQTDPSDVDDKKSQNRYNIKNISKMNKSISKSNQPINNQNQDFDYASSIDPCKLLEKKQLEIQNLSFCDNYLLVSLMNRQIRLYAFRKTIHGFSETLIFEKNYPVIISYLLLYKSQTRKLYNIMIVKLLDDEQSSVHIFELDEQMQIEKESFHCKLHSSPAYEEMPQLGFGGFTENGYIFMVEFNSSFKKNRECLSFEKFLRDPETGQKLSISSMKLHNNSIYIYLGTKKGEIFIYDRFSHMIRTQKKISKYPIDQIIFINEGSEFLFWDRGGRIGITSSQSLLVSQIYPSQTSVHYHYIEQFYDPNYFLMFSSRSMGIMSISCDKEKEYAVHKPLKLFSRRKKLSSKLRGLEIKSNNESFKSSEQKRILEYFITEKSMTFILSDFQIMIFDENLQYIGSNFTLKAQNIKGCEVCPQLKFLGILYENNSIDIINIYNQQVILHYSAQQEIYRLFFCGSSVHFFGFLTKTSNILSVFGFPLPNEHKDKGPILSKPISDSVKIQDKLRDKYIIKFYRGSMVWIDTESAQITFFNKKIFTRCRVFSLGEKNKPISLLQARQYQKGILSVLDSKLTVYLFDMTRKNLKYKADMSMHFEYSIKQVRYFHYYKKEQESWSMIKLEKKEGMKKESSSEKETYQITSKKMKIIRINEQEPFSSVVSQLCHIKTFSNIFMMNNTLISVDCSKLQVHQIFGPDSIPNTHILIDLQNI